MYADAKREGVFDDNAHALWRKKGTKWIVDDWGIGNTAPAAFLTLVPFVGFIWVFVVGAHGSEWAWRNRHWDSVAQFQATQRRWARWGVAVWLGGFALFVLVFALVFGVLKDSEAYKLAEARLNADTRVTNVVGRPMSMGLPSGEIHTADSGGSAKLSFSVVGPGGEGSAFVWARIDEGKWKIERLLFVEDGTGHRIELTTPPEEEVPAGAT
ncbi:MAG: hypothetical protein EOP39_19445 [Rubrivivax sp.]|nr:MAG: hypothetical protein EOP39_19445 [Rubrivivax sp.]